MIFLHGRPPSFVLLKPPTHDAAAPLHQDAIHLLALPPPPMRSAERTAFEAPPRPLMAPIPVPVPAARARARNHGVVQAFLRHRANETDVRKATTACICRCRDFEEVAACLDETQKVRLRDGSGVMLNLIMFTAALGVCARTGAALQARQLIDRMPQFGLLPDVECHTRMLEACRRGDRLDLAMEWFSDQLSRHHDGRPNGLDTQTFKHLMQICIDTWQPLKLLDIFDLVMVRPSMPAVVPDIDCYRLALEGCARCHRVDDLLRVFAHLETEGATFGLAPEAGTCGELIAGLAWGCLTDEALAVFDRLQDHGRTPVPLRSLSTYHTLMVACRKAGRPADVVRLFRHLQEHGAAVGVTPSSESLDLVLSACDPSDEAALLQEAIDAGMLTTSLGRDEHTGIFDLQGESLLRPTAEHASRRRFHPRVVRAVFRRLCREGRIGPDTRFAVGQRRGPQSMRFTLANCMSEAGWFPQHPLLDDQSGVLDDRILVGRSCSLSPYALPFTPQREPG